MPPPMPGTELPPVPFQYRLGSPFLLVGQITVPEKDYSFYRVQVHGRAEPMLCGPTRFAVRNMRQWLTILTIKRFPENRPLMRNVTPDSLPTPLLYPILCLPRFQETRATEQVSKRKEVLLVIGG